MTTLRRFAASVVAAPVVALALAAAPAMAATVHPDAPYPACGDHFTLSRAGSNIHVVGVDLGAFSSGYMLVWPAADGKGYGPYNAAPSYGAGFTFNTGETSKTTVSIDLTDADNTVTLCSSDYTV
jgi:hypothetical protein